MPVTLVDHPLVRHKLGLLREAGASTKTFRELAGELARLLAYEATRDFETEEKVIQGWAGAVTVERIKGKMVTLVPILRAGFGMLEGVLDLIPGAKVSVLGFHRDEQTLAPVFYYANLAKEIDKREALILDPMLATGGTLAAAVDLLKNAGCRRIKALILVAAPEGLAKLEAAHPDVRLFVAGIDEKLNDSGYILPGLGDAGDKVFGTT